MLALANRAQHVLDVKLRRRGDEYGIDVRAPAQRFHVRKSLSVKVAAEGIQHLGPDVGGSRQLDLRMANDRGNGARSERAEAGDAETQWLHQTSLCHPELPCARGAPQMHEYHYSEQPRRISRNYKPTRDSSSLRSSE